MVRFNFEFSVCLAKFDLVVSESVWQIYFDPNSDKIGEIGTLFCLNEVGLGWQHWKGGGKKVAHFPWVQKTVLYIQVSTIGCTLLCEAV